MLIKIGKDALNSRAKNTLNNRGKILNFSVVKDNVTKDVTKDATYELTERQKVILMVIKENPLVTIPEMSLKMNVVTRTIKRDIEVLKSKGFLKREGSSKEGHWEIVDESAKK